MPVGGATGTGRARQQHQRSRLCLLVPAADRRYAVLVAHQHGVQPLAEQLLGELRVPPAGTHEVRERAQHCVAELRLVLEQRLSSGREAHPLALELGKRIASSCHLRDRLLRLALGGAVMRLLLLELRHAAARTLELLRRLHRRPRLHLRLLCPPTRLGSRRPLGLRPCGALPRRLGQLLPELYSLPLERRAFSLQCPEPLGSALQVLLELAHRRALGEQPVADLLLQRRAAGQLLSDGCEVALGRDALGGGRTPLLLRLDDAASSSPRRCPAVARRCAALRSRSAASARSPSSRPTSSFASARRRSTSVRCASAICRACTRASRSCSAAPSRPRSPGSAAVRRSARLPSSPRARSMSSSSRRTSVRAIPKRSSIIFPYRSAFPRWRASERTCVCTSPTKSSRRARSAAVSSSRRSVLSFRLRYRPIP